MQASETVSGRGCESRRGFTLIELMIVVVIIGILAAIAIPRFMDVSRQAKAAEARPLLKQILTLQERYQAKEGSYTSDLMLLEGGATLAASGRYYSFSADTSHPTGLCIQANPNADGIAAGLPAQSMDALADTYQSSSCS